MRIIRLFGVFVLFVLLMTAVTVPSAHAVSCALQWRSATSGGWSADISNAVSCSSPVYGISAATTVGTAADGMFYLNSWNAITSNNLADTVKTSIDGTMDVQATALPTGGGMAMIEFRYLVEGLGSPPPSPLEWKMTGTAQNPHPLAIHPSLTKVEMTLQISDAATIGGGSLVANPGYTTVTTPNVGAQLFDGDFVFSPSYSIAQIWKVTASIAGVGTIADPAQRGSLSSQVSLSNVPEPSTLLMMAFVVLLLPLMHMWKRR